MAGLVVRWRSQVSLGGRETVLLVLVVDGVVALAELHRAEPASKPLLAGVDPLMPTHVAALGEPHVAVAAAVRLLTGVCPLVFLGLAPSGEPLRAEAARVPFLLGVRLLICDIPGKKYRHRTVAVGGVSQLRVIGRHPWRGQAAHMTAHTPQPPS